MRAVLETIGIFVIATIAIAIPILMAISIFYDWLAIFKIIFTLLTLLVWVNMYSTIGELEDKR